MKTLLFQLFLAEPAAFTVNLVHHMKDEEETAEKVEGRGTV